MNYYRDTKRLATEEAIKYAEKKNLNLTIIEPVWVFGEREYTTFYQYLKTAKTTVPFFPGSKTNKFHVIYVKDLARAYILAIEKKLQNINRFIIGNPESEYLDKIFQLFCQEAGYRKPLNIPKFFLYPFVLIIEFLYTLFRVKKPPIITRGRLNMFYNNIEYSIKKAEKILKFKTEYDLESGIERTVKWYEEAKWL